MARLAEPPIALPPPSCSLATGTGAGGGESIEALRRRFIRQNRELAKNNSSQSLRIRNLENEISKLLGDNLNLREQVLGLENELHNARAQATKDTVKRLKCELMVKISELSGLVDGLGDLETEAVRPEAARHRTLSPSQREYRERQPLAELMQDTVMPTITEDKSYPRRTLNADEIRAIRLSDHSAASGSPDIGPPPVAHFELNNSQESEQRSQSPAPASPKVVDEDLLPSVNLETRRKRKDGSSKTDPRRQSLLAEPPTKMEAEPATTMLRTGAKRKLADREVEKAIKPPSQGDFTFSRKPAAEQAGSDEEKTKDPKQQETAPTEQASQPILELAKPSRRILGDKSVNMSPRKAEAKAGKTVKDDLRKLTVTKPTLNKPARGRRASSIPAPLPQEEDIFDPVNIDLPPPELSTAEQLRPKTPGLPDIFSPPLSQSPTRASEACDTPPPSSLSTSSNTTEGGQRPSRRARSAVNYAEPSLIAKMRRPGKQMVDAISGLQDPKRVMNPSTERKSVGGPTSATRVVVIKKEPVDDDSAWKDPPRNVNRRETGSPLLEKSTDDHPPALPTTDSILDKEISRPPSSSETAARSSVIAASRKRREQLDRRSTSQPILGTDIDAATKKMEEMDLYDFKDSSSPAPEPEVKPATSKLTHRRHSSVPKNIVASSAEPAKTENRSERAAGRRRSMMI